jgi:hypothetical protein
MSRVRRKNNNSQSGAGGPSKRTKTLDLGWKNGQGDEHIDSDAEEDNDYQEPALDSEEVEEEETLDAKKIRLARQYLQKLEAGDSDDDTSSSSDDQDDDQEEDEHDKIGLKLQRERLKREGALERAVADKVEKSITSFQTSIQMTSDSEKEAQEWIAEGRVKLLRGHDLTPTCVALQSSGEKAISGSKDHSVIIWDVHRKLSHYATHGNEKRSRRPLGLTERYFPLLAPMTVDMPLLENEMAQSVFTTYDRARIILSRRLRVTKALSRACASEHSLYNCSLAVTIVA